MVATTRNPNPLGLIVGNYCHDVLIKDDVVLAESLGGAVAFISAVLEGLNLPFNYVTKVGSDFAYDVIHPVIVSGATTAVFHAYFESDPSEIRREDRVLKRIRSSDPISPADLPDDVRFRFGLAVGIAGEIVPETLEKMLDLCDVVLVDVQALIRVFDEIDGTVKLVNLKETRFYHLIPRIGFLKASAEEAPFVDVDECRKWCCVVVTSGEDGCTVYWKDGEMKISPFLTVQIDPTGAGDSFLGGLVAGLVQGLAVPDAALLGNFFGSLTVEQIGLPEFDFGVMQENQPPSSSTTTNTIVVDGFIHRRSYSRRRRVHSLLELQPFKTKPVAVTVVGSSPSSSTDEGVAVYGGGLAETVDFPVVRNSGSLLHHRIHLVTLERIKWLHFWSNNRNNKESPG